MSLCALAGSVVTAFHEDLRFRRYQVQTMAAVKKFLLWWRIILGFDFLSAQGLLVDPVGRQVLDSKTLKPLSKTPTAAGTLRSKFAATLSSGRRPQLLAAFSSRRRRANGPLPLPPPRTGRKRG